MASRAVGISADVVAAAVLSQADIVFASEKEEQTVALNARLRGQHAFIFLPGPRDALAYRPPVRAGL